MLDNQELVSCTQLTETFAVGLVKVSVFSTYSKYLWNIIYSQAHSNAPKHP